MTLRKKCPYLKSFWSEVSSIWTEYGVIRYISPYSAPMQEMQTRITCNSETFHAVWKAKLSNKSSEYFLLIWYSPHHPSIDHIKFQLIYQFFWFHAEKLIREHNPYKIFFSFINKPVTAISKTMTSDALIKSKTFCSFIQFFFY